MESWRSEPPYLVGGAHAERRPRPIAPFLLMSGCATVPITGRTQLNMISDQQLAATADQDFAKFAGLVVKTMPRYRPPQAAALLATVNRVSAKIIDAAG